MKRGGRKRKSGKREPNGRIQRERGPNPNELAARMPHRASEVIYAEFRKGTAEVSRIVKSYVPQSELHNEKAESPLGRLRLVGAISEEQYLAGRQFANDVARYRRAIEAKRQPQSIAGFGQPIAGTAPDLDVEQALRVINNYMLAFESLGSRANQCAVKHVVIQELELEPGLFRYLDIGLDKLISHYGLTT